MPEKQRTLTHLDSHGAVHMVNVGSKEATTRRAVAEATVQMSPQTATAIAAGNSKKGDVLATARIAAIQAAKRTPELIPLAHPIALHSVTVEIDLNVELGALTITAKTSVTGETGVEMEALTAVSVGALTIYDMVKGIERGVTIKNIRLLEKTGGKSDWKVTD